MSEHSNIQWTDSTWNPIVGCTIVSPGCTNCYAMKWAHSGMKAIKHYDGTTKVVNGHAIWTGLVRQAPEHILMAPLKWKKPRRIFVNSMSDLFHEDVPDEWIDRVFAVMALCPQHVFQVLTKRSKRMMAYCLRPKINEIVWDKADEFACDLRLPENHPSCDYLLGGKAGAAWPLPNVWLGVSCEDQTRADERIPDLLATPAAVRFVSAEPLLGPIDFSRHIEIRMPSLYSPVEVNLDWIIVGGESGPGSRPFDLAWGRSIIGQCQAAGVPVFMKQLGAQPLETMGSTMRHDDPNDIELMMEKAMTSPPPKGWTRIHDGRKTSLYRYHRLKNKKGGDPLEWPEDLRVRQMP